MSYSISPSDDGSYLILKITGDINRQTAMQYNLKAHAAGAELGISCYLVDLTESRNVDSTVDTYEFAYQDMRDEPRISRSARIALLVAPGDHSHDFVETVARNSGLNVVIFTDRAAAEEYFK